MIGGPLRGSRPVDPSANARPANRAQPQRVYRQSEEPEQAFPAQEPASAPVHQATIRSGRKEKAMKQARSIKDFKLPIILLVVLLVAVLGWFIWSGMQNNKTAIDSSKYQAVFLSNGQVYFGKLATFNDEYMKLQDVFYLQGQQAQDEASSNPQQPTAGSGDLQLIKLGDEVHGPEDEMIISKDQVLFFENLKDDGKVAESISQFKSSN